MKPLIKAINKACLVQAGAKPRRSESWQTYSTTRCCANKYQVQLCYEMHTRYWYWKHQRYAWRNEESNGSNRFRNSSSSPKLVSLSLVEINRWRDWWNANKVTEIALNTVPQLTGEVRCRTNTEQAGKGHQLPCKWKRSWKYLSSRAVWDLLHKIPSDTHKLTLANCSTWQYYQPRQKSEQVRADVCSWLWNSYSCCRFWGS